MLLLDALGDVWAACTRGTPPTEQQRARLWGASIHAARTAKTIVTSMYEAAGTSALYNGCLIERAHRDIHAVLQHGTMTPAILEDVGRVRFGIKPNYPLF